MERSKARTWVEININNLKHNAIALKNLLKDDCQMMCAVKANAYGHGMVKIADAYKDIADQFAVSCLDEAEELRTSKINKPILILGYTPENFAEDLIKLDIAQTVYSYDYAKRLNENLKNSNSKLKVHIKIDSGMSRLGFSVKDEEDLKKSFREILEMHSTLKNLEFIGMFTHFHSSDSLNKELTDIQFDKFMKLKSKLDDSNIKFKFYHSCNSAAMIRFPHMHLNLTRPGVALYGIFPGETEKIIDLKPTLELKTRVSQIHTVKKGEGISYNTTFTAEKNMTVATIPIGYADGYFRSLSNIGDVIVNGKRARIVGNICMDQCVIDITDIKVSEGDIVTLLGKEGNEYISADEIANKVGTIPHEIFCSISSRVRKVYID